MKNINALGEGGLLVSNTPYGEQFAKSRLRGAGPVVQIPNWLYDVAAHRRAGRPVSPPGNHSATEIQAVGLLAADEAARCDHRRAARPRRYLNRPVPRRAGRSSAHAAGHGADARARITSTCCRSTRTWSAATCRR